MRDVKSPGSKSVRLRWNAAGILPTCVYFSIQKEEQEIWPAQLIVHLCAWYLCLFVLTSIGLSHPNGSMMTSGKSWGMDPTNGWIDLPNTSTKRKLSPPTWCVLLHVSRFICGRNDRYVPIHMIALLELTALDKLRNILYFFRWQLWCWLISVIWILNDSVWLSWQLSLNK